MIVEIIAVSVIAVIVGVLLLAGINALWRKQWRMTHQCTKAAEWHLDDKELYCDTYSCTEHLSKMVSDDTTIIYAYHEEGQCCYLGPKCSISESSPFDPQDLDK